MNIVVFGANGRVGRAVVNAAKKRGHEVFGIDVGGSDVPPFKTDAVIDFSSADATKRVCDFCLMHGVPLVTGVTGRDRREESMLETLKTKCKVVAKANFSQGAEMLEKIAALAARELRGWDCEIVEIHKKSKKDAPSGTAKTLASRIAMEKGSFASVTVHSLRCGSNFGRHTAVFASDGESLILTHQAESVDVFALGAVRECEKLINGSV